MSGRPAAGGGRWVTVDPDRLAGWLAGFAERHGPLAVEPGGAVTLTSAVTVTAADGSVAVCHVPFPPLAWDPADPCGGLVGHAGARRTVGVLLFRLGGHAAGVFEGSELVASKVGARQVHGRSSAGGWSQQRFARRREGQVAVAVTAAADCAARVLLPWADRLDALVLGGDRAGVAAVLADARLAAVRGKVVEPLLDVPDPRLKVLVDTPRLFRAVRIRLVEASGASGASGDSGA